MQYLLVFHSKNDYANAPRCYVILILPLLSSFYETRNRVDLNICTSTDLQYIHNFTYTLIYFIIVFKIREFKGIFMRTFSVLQLGLSAINPLNPELNPICYLLALLGAHHFLHVSRIRVKLLTFRLLMSYIY